MSDDDTHKHCLKLDTRFETGELMPREVGRLVLGDGKHHLRLYISTKGLIAAIDEKAVGDTLHLTDMSRRVK